MHELVYLKTIFVLTHAPKAPQIKEVIWHPSIVSHIDGTTKGILEPADCGGIFRDSNAAIVGCLSQNLNLFTAFHLELTAVMHTIVIA